MWHSCEGNAEIRIRVIRTVQIREMEVRGMRVATVITRQGQHGIRIAFHRCFRTQAVARTFQGCR